MAARFEDLGLIVLLSTKILILSQNVFNFVAGKILFKEKRQGMTKYFLIHTGFKRFQYEVSVTSYATNLMFYITLLYSSICKEHLALATSHIDMDNENTIHQVRLIVVTQVL